MIQTRPNEILPFFELGAKDALKLFLTQQSAQVASENNIPEFQIILKSTEATHSLRKLTAEHVNKLIKVRSFIYPLMLQCNTY